MSEALLRAAQVLVEEGVDLSKIPETNKDKIEFLELIELYLEKKLNSLQKARLEFLVGHMSVIYNRELQKETREEERKKMEEKKAKREKERKMLNRKTKRGQPVLRNLAKIQLERVKDMIESEKRKK